jgi:uncharacterized protein (DUF4415 family)
MSKAKRPVPPVLSDEEEAAIQAEIAADPDGAELSDAELDALRSASDVLPAPLLEALTAPRGRGRPRKENAKVPVKLRLDPDVLSAFRTRGPGWQTSINQILREAAFPKHPAKSGRR